MPFGGAEILSSQGDKKMFQVTGGGMGQLSFAKNIYIFKVNIVPNCMKITRV